MPWAGADRRAPRRVYGVYDGMHTLPLWRAPSGYSRGARVYDHTTTARHDMSTPPPSLYT